METNKFAPIKRTKALNFLAFFLLVTFLVLIYLSVLYEGYLHKVWFSIALVYLGIYLLTRAFFFRLDSNFLLGSILFTFGVLSGVFFFVSFEFKLESYFLALSLCFLLAYFIFRQNFYIISFALSFVQMLLLVINKIYLSGTIFLVVQAIYFIAIFVILVLVVNLKRKRQSGISNK